jgi:hypothetical protein
MTLAKLIGGAAWLLGTAHDAVISQTIARFMETQWPKYTTRPRNFLHQRPGGCGVNGKSGCGFAGFSRGASD